jgi:D-alanyl-lipoteichoic acid acyltransferase DltB (MBOAT superfamily)
VPLSSLRFALLATLLLLTTPLRPDLRRAALLGASLLFAGSWLDARSALALAAIVLAGWGASVAVRAGRRWLAPATIALLVAAFLVIKRYEVLAALLPAGALDHGLVIVGASYILFRQVQLLVDAAQGQVNELDFGSYVAFLLGFWTLLAGPIQRYQEFRSRWLALGDRAATRDEALQRLDRVATGYVKLVILGPLLLAAAGPTTPQPAARELLAFYAFPVYVYVNFSGYCDVVIGLAAALGLELPENFDRPYVARNVLDFWNRWHMTLSGWLKGYVFNPLVKAGLERSDRKLAVASGAYLVTFFLAGVWHGSTLNFAVFGAFHAVGAAATKIYEEALKRRLGRDGYKRYLATGWIRAVSTVLTLHWTALSFVFFRRDMSELRALVATMGQAS